MNLVHGGFRLDTGSQDITGLGANTRCQCRRKEKEVNIFPRAIEQDFAKPRSASTYQTGSPTQPNLLAEAVTRLRASALAP